MSGSELPPIIREVSPSYFIWKFKKEEAQEIEKSYSFNVKVKERGKERRGRRKEEEKIPELGTLL